MIERLKRRRESGLVQEAKGWVDMLSRYGTEPEEFTLRAGVREVSSKPCQAACRRLLFVRDGRREFTPYRQAAHYPN